MERIINNPGFEDIAKNIFMMLNLNDVANCQLVSRSFNGFLENPMFWLKKWITRGLSKKNQKDWITAIDKMDKTKDTELIKNILLYFKKMLKKCEFIDMPCFIDKRKHSLKYLQENQKSLEKLFHQAFEDKDMGSLQLLVPLLKNPNATFPTGSSWFLKKYAGYTPVQVATGLQNSQIIKVLAPLSDNLNNPYPFVQVNDETSLAHDDGFTPIYFAAQMGYAEIVEILAPLVANLNTDCNIHKLNPLGMAIKNGHLHVVKILVPFVDDLNTVHGPTGPSTIGLAAMYGHLEIIKFLAQFIEPNRPNISGVAPIFHAILRGQPEAVRLLAELSKNLSTPLSEGLTPLKFAEVAAEVGAGRADEIVAILKTFENANSG